MPRRASVIIPTYFRNDRLRRAVESALGQRYSDVEVIVVDDSGTGHAAPIAEARDRVRYIPLEENGGAPAARERGFEASTGDFVQFLDDDDVLTAEKIAQQVALLEASDDVGVAYCGVESDFDGEVLPDPEKRGDVLEHALKFDMMPCFLSSMLIERRHVEGIAPLNRYEGAQDLGMMVKLARRTAFDFVDGTLVRKGGSDDSLGATLEAVRSRKRLLRDFEALYDAFPAEVRRAALAETYFREGAYYADESRWSPSAIGSFLRANYYAPELRPQYLKRLCLSLFGQWGLDAGRSVAALRH